MIFPFKYDSIGLVNIRMKRMTIGRNTNNAINMNLQLAIRPKMVLDKQHRDVPESINLESAIHCLNGDTGKYAGGTKGKTLSN